MQEQVSIIEELEEAVRSGSSAKRISTLRQVTDLFLHDAERLSEDQVKVFDDVLCHLVASVETRVKAEVSARLAAIENAPSGLIERLAWDDKIAVAGNTRNMASPGIGEDRIETEAIDPTIAPASKP